jgi:hypothetical protein
MRNCIITGSGRSGTSLLAGILYHSGYFLGDNLYKPRHSNPTGFFESALVNGINEEMMKQMPFQKNWSLKTTNESPYSPAKGQWWLALTKTSTLSDVHVESDKISELTSHTPFAFKDPRFAYTLLHWEPLLPDNTLVIVLFRDPQTTVNSILKECASVAYLQNFDITRDQAFIIWNNVYSHLLTMEKRSKLSFSFIFYEDLISREAIPYIESCIGKQLTTQIIEPSLYRSKSKNESPYSSEKIFQILMSKRGIYKK